MNSGPGRRDLHVTYLPADSPPDISNIDLTYLLPVPVTGRSPTVSFQTGSYKGDVTWMILGEDMPKGLFQPDTVYAAQVTLIPEAGYKFDANPNVVHPGGTVGRPAQDSEKVSVLITFPKTETAMLSRFSGSSSDERDSAIDLIRAAANQKSLHIEMTAETEQVKFEEDDVQVIKTDFGKNGLVLEYSTDPDRKTSTSPKELVIDGGGLTVKLTGDPAGKPVITVGEGVTLTLRNITFKGLVLKSNKTLNDYGDDARYFENGDDDANNNAPLIVVKNGGTLIMEKGAVLTENNAYVAQKTGGLRVENGGTVIMNGGEISKTAGVDIVEVEGGTFTMNGGTIYHNTGLMSGGIYMTDGSSTMHGGTINENRALGGGGGVVLKLAAVFNMKGGTISGNKTAGYGGGVNMNDGVFIMDGGTVSNNSSNESGGGVYLGTGTFSMNNGSVSGNYAVGRGGGGGGGVYVHEGTFVLNYGTITGNKVGKDANGGGVYVGKDGIFKMELGSISGNVLNPTNDPMNDTIPTTVTPPPPSDANWEDKWKNIWKDEVGGTGKGAGVYVAHGGIFTKTGGSITGVMTTPGDDPSSEWVDTSFQNYYLWPIQTYPDSVGYLPPPYDPFSDEIIGYRGFAIYYDNDHYWNASLNSLYNLEIKNGDVITSDDNKDEGDNGDNNEDG